MNAQSRGPVAALAVAAVVLLAGPAAASVSDVVHERPVPGAVIRAYDPPAKRWLPGHRGVDLAAPEGSAVVASGDGVVHFAGMVAGMPNVSVMHADGIRTTYQPVDPIVARGDSVRRGDVLGTLAEGPDPGLHWGALRGDDYLNPLDLLARRPIVLKPVRPRPGQARGWALRCASRRRSEDTWV